MMTRVVKEAEERREELLDIGMTLYMKGGSKNVSIQKVVEQAGVATGLFYYYFKNKEDFIEQATQRYVQISFAHLEGSLKDEEATPSERIITFLDFFWNSLSVIGDVMDERFANAPNHLQLEKAFTERVRQPVTDFIKEGVAAGEFTVVEPEMTALGLIGGYMAIFHGGPYPDAKKAQKETYRFAFATLGCELPESVLQLE